MKSLGHKNIKNILLYVQLANVLFKNISEDFTCKVAKTPTEISELIEAGFEYVEKDDLLYFRKRK